MRDLEEISNTEFDVVIVGAGPAGCSCAYFSAVHGFKVLLIDKAVFPRDKCCGDAVSPPALSVLDRMGVLQRIDDVSYFKAEGFSVSAPNGAVMRASLPAVEGLRDYGYVIPRKDFDALLLEYVKMLPNVSVLEDCRAIDLIHDGIDIVGVKAECQGAPATLTGQAIVGADGVNSIIAKKLSLRNNEPNYSAFAVRAYFENVEGLDNYCQIHYEKQITPAYAWVFPTSKTTANIGIGIQNRYARTNDVRKLFELYIEKNRSAGEMLSNAKMVEGSVKGWSTPLGNYPSKRSHQNVLLLGDAGSFVDVLTGEGIYYALRSGEFAVQALTETLRKGENNISPVYERIWSKEWKREEYFWGAVLGRFLSVEPLVNMSIKRAIKKPKKAERLAGVLGHSIPKRKLLF